uniref:Selenoprotein F/M domain-containing protein n=1 Tax=Trypanosoma congolense (strain IL3000) TaxID=1068625 RepID=G0UZD0_TRYCI|nr:conserved hypothetical protein [Trypanosoma congolense IL3000]
MRVLGTLAPYSISISLTFSPSSTGLFTALSFLMQPVVSDYCASFLNLPSMLPRSDISLFFPHSYCLFFAYRHCVAGEMHTMRYFLAVITLFLLVGCGTGRGEADAPMAPSPAEECRRLGFQRPYVWCRHCELLKHHTEATALHEECLICCHPDKIQSEERYESARLVVNRKAPEGPDREVDKFVAAYKEKFGSRLQIIQTDFDRPTHLVLLGKRGDDDLQWNVEDWSMSSLHDYLAHVFNLETDEQL